MPLTKDGADKSADKSAEKPTRGEGAISASSLQVRTELVATNLGGVEVHTLDVRGLQIILAAFERVGFRDIPIGGGLADYLTPEQREQAKAIKSPAELSAFMQAASLGLDAAARAEIGRNLQRKIQAGFEWLMASHELAPAVIRAVTYLSYEEAGSLTLASMLRVASKGIELLDVEDLVDAGATFFTQTTARMGPHVEKFASLLGRKAPAASDPPAGS